MTVEKSARPRTKPPEIRREELMDAAEQLFLAQGIAATSIDAIVAGAGVAKGTFYLYFQSKEQLLTALRQRFIDAVCAELRAAIDRCPAGDWRARMRAWVA
ncbi:MAG: helix-turn-helix domain-containing protein, partial [Steroidobacteraceae bacterium]